MKLKASEILRGSIVVFAIAGNLILAACGTREVPVTVHEGPVVGDEVVVAPTGPSVDVSALKTADPSALNIKLVASRQRGATPLTITEKLSTLNTLAPFVLNRSYLEDPRVTNTKEMRAALSGFASTLTDLAATNPEAAAPWIEKARVVIESGCDGQMQGCTNLRFFRGDGDSAKIMEISARSLDASITAEKNPKRHDDLVRLYYRRLSVSFDLRNQIADPQFEFLYLARAADYAEAFGRSENKSRERELLTRHSEVFEMILNRFNPDLTDPTFRTRFEGFVNAFSPWNYSRRVENPFGQAATRMLSLAAKSFLYDGKTGKLSSSLTESIKRSQQTVVATDGAKEDPLDSLDDSFAMISGALKDQEKGIWKNLVLTDSIPQDEYFFMIDRIYGDHLTPDDASEIWRGSHRDQTALLKAAEQYIKIQIAGQIVRTNRYMSSIYSNKEWSSATLFQKAVEKSYPISTQWNQMLSRIDRIQLFLDRNLKASDDCYSSEDFRNVNQMLTSVRRNIKYLSVYPNMMLMAYFMAEVKFKLPVVTFFGTYEIDSATIIGWFFDGKLAPLFNFGNDGESLKRIETLYAFLFALKTETFRAFSVSETKKLDIPRFFEVVIGKYLDSDRIELEQSLEGIRKDMRQSAAMATFLQVCRQDRDLITQGIKPGSKGATLPIDFGQMANGVYVGSGGSGSYGSDAWSFHSGRLVENVKSVNESLRRKLDFVGIMVGLLEKHLEKSGVDKTSRDATTAQIQSYLANVRGLQREYLTEVTRWNKTLSICLDQSVKIEIDRQNDLVELEMRHLKKVWSLMKAARTANNAAEVTQASEYLKSTLGLNELNAAANYKPISQITGDEYVYAELDVLLRMRQNLKVVAPNVRVLMPSDLTDTSYWRERRQVTITFNDVEADFVREGLRNFNESYSAYSKWMNTTSDPEVFANRLKLDVELYKLGTVKIYDTSAQVCQGKSNITECPIVDYSMSARDVVNETANVIALLSMTEKGGALKRDAQYVQLVGSTSRWPKDKLKKFMLDENGDPWSLYEMVYKTLTEDESALNEARDFNRTESSVGHFLFQPEAEFKAILGRGFAPLVNGFFGRVKDFETAIKEREQSDVKANTKLEYSYEIRQGKVQTATLETEAGAPVYLERQKIDDFSTRRMLFDRETGNAFSSTGRTKTVNESCRQ
ncbi:hypothetical protein BH10BDE1_BH10BDE1_24050 [soil metagenome]